MKARLDRKCQNRVQFGQKFQRAEREAIGELKLCDSYNMSLYNFQFSPGAAQPTTVTTTGPTGKPRVTITEFDSSPLNQRSLKSPGTSSSGTPCTPPLTSGDKHRRYSMASRVSNFSYMTLRRLTQGFKWVLFKYLPFVSIKGTYNCTLNGNEGTQITSFYL